MLMTLGFGLSVTASCRIFVSLACPFWNPGPEVQAA